jgi:hypothetical protein
MNIIVAFLFIMSVYLWILIGVLEYQKWKSNNIDYNTEE